MNRVRLAIGGALAVAVLVVGGAVAVTSSGVLLPPITGVTLDRAVPALPLIGADGRSTSLAALHGRYVVFAPFMTLCHEVCPITTGAIIEMREAVEAAGLGSQVAFVEATVDPGRDSPQRLRAYAKLTGANWALLTGTPAQVAALWQFFGVAYERQPIVSPAPTDWLTGQPEAYDVAHTDALFFLDEAGHERIVIAGGPDLGGRLDTRLSGLLDAQGRENLAHPQGAWTVPQALGNLGHLLGRSIAPPAP